MVLANEYGNTSIINLFIDIQHPDDDDNIATPSDSIPIPGKSQRLDKLLSQMTLEGIILDFLFCL